MAGGHSGINFINEATSLAEQTRQFILSSKLGIRKDSDEDEQDSRDKKPAKKKGGQKTARGKDNEDVSFFDQSTKSAKKKAGLTKAKKSVQSQEQLSFRARDVLVDRSDRIMVSPIERFPGSTRNKTMIKM